MNAVKLCSIQSLVLLIVPFWLSGCATTSPQTPQWHPLETSKLEQPLSLEQCLDFALINDIHSVQWEARLNAAHSELTQATILPNPTFSPSWDDVGLKDDVGKSISSLTYGFSYPIFFWWPRAKQIDAANAHQEAEEAAVFAERRQLQLDIASAYFTLVADRRKVQLSQDIVANSHEFMRLVQKQNDLGRVSDFTIGQASTELLKTESELNDARSQLRIDQLAFAFALGTDRPCYPTVVDYGDQYNQPTGCDPMAESLSERELEVVIQLDPTLREMQAATRGAAAQVEVEKRNAIPLTGVSGSAGPKQAPEGTGSAFGIDVPIPLFDRNQAGIQRAEAELKAAQADEEKARREVIAAVSQVWESYHASVIKWNRFAAPLCEAAKKNAKDARILFEAGRLQYQELLQTERDSKQMLLNAVDDWKALNAAVWTLDCYLGKHESRD